MSAIVRIENLGYAYPPVIPGEQAPWVLNGVDLEIEQGEFLSIMGLTGAGKTTLCLALNGIVPQSTGGKIRGAVWVGDVNTKRHPVADLARRVGLVFQEPETQLFNMTVEAEVAFGLESIGLPRQEIGQRINWALALVGMQDHKRRSPFQLSGGEKQRVAIASILALRPQIIVLDEPTASLDPIGKSEVFRIVGELQRQSGLTIVMVEHKSEQIAEFSDRVVVLEGGVVVERGSPREIFRQIERMEEIGLAVPQVSELAGCLDGSARKNRLFTRIDEAFEALSDRNGIGVRSDRLQNDRLAGADEGILPARPEPPAGAEMAEPALLAVEDLTFTYDDGTTALQGINLSIQPGEFVAVIGKNGSGKTTLGKLLNGLFRPTSGRVLHKNEDIRNRPVGQLARSVGYVFQNPDHQIFSATTREEIAFGPRNLGLDENAILSRTEQALARFGLQAHADHPPAALGYGLRRQITLAAADAMRTPVLVLDEPSTGLDARQKSAVMAWVRRLNREGVTIVLITHDMEIVAEHVPRCVVLKEGRVAMDASTRFVFRQAGLLQETGIELPQITRLAQRMHRQGMRDDILTVPEFCEAFHQLAQGTRQNEASDADGR